MKIREETKEGSKALTALEDQSSSQLNLPAIVQDDKPKKRGWFSWLRAKFAIWGVVGVISVAFGHEKK